MEKIEKNSFVIELDDENKLIKINFSDSSFVSIGSRNSSLTISDCFGNTIQMGNKGISINSVGEVNIIAKEKINIHAETDVEISGLNINQNAQVELKAKGNAAAELSSSGQTTIKGALVKIN